MVGYIGFLVINLVEEKTVDGSRLQAVLPGAGARQLQGFVLLAPKTSQGTIFVLHILSPAVCLVICLWLFLTMLSVAQNIEPRITG
jgi:hypothetical protein